MKKSVKRLAACLCFILIFALLLACANYVLRDKSGAEGIYLYYKEERNSLDVLFIGSSHIMCGILPSQLWRERGITSYDFASSALVTAEVYYMVREAFRTQSPKLVFLDVSGVVYEEKLGTKEYLHVMLDNMRWSRNKLEAIADLAAEEGRAEYFLPFIKFHTRWKSLEGSDFMPVASSEKGAVIYDRVMEGAAAPELIRPDECHSLSPVAEEYLRKTLDFLSEQDVEVVLIKTPVQFGRERQELYNEAGRIGAEYGYPFLNLMYFTDEMGFDYVSDMTDKNHCNRSGAQKVTRFVGGYIAENYAAADRRQDAAYAQWRENFE